MGPRRIVGGLRFAALLGLLACRAQPSSTTRPSESQLEDEKKRVARGEDVGASLSAPAIAIDGAGLRVNEETLATLASLPTERHATITPLLGHLRALREHWTKIHPGRELAGAASVTLAPDVSADLALDVLRTLAAAGFLAAKVRSSAGGEVVTLALARPGAVAFDVITFVQKEARAYEVTIWMAGDHCSVIMVTDGAVDPAKLPPHFRLPMLGGNARSEGGEHLMVTMRAGATAPELTALLARAMGSPLLGALRPKLLFEWAPVSCPTDGKFGHAR